VQFWTSEIEKQVGHRVQIILDDPQLLRVYQRFGAEALRRSSVFHGLDAFLKARGVRGDTCFEIGTWNALTSVVLSRYFRQVVTCDLTVYSNPMKHEILKELGITNVRCVDIADNEEKRRLADRLKFDFAYMDGNHADDTDSDWAICERGGRVLFHEAWPWQTRVWNLVHTLPHNQVAHSGMGLALWDRTGA
jgi:hypothetical protein